MDDQEELLEVAIPGGLRNVAVDVGVDKVVPSHPPELFPLHTCAAFLGQCGSGKTNAMILEARRYLDHGSFNRVFVMSPTYDTNTAFLSLPEVRNEDVYRDHIAVQTSVGDIMQAIKESVKEWKSYLLIKDVMERKARGEQLSQREEELYNSMVGREIIPVERPSPLIIIDDLSHSNLFSPSPSNPFINLVLRHRHLEGVGATIFFCCQTFRGGITKALRTGAVRQFHIFPCHDSTQLQAIYQEAGSMVTREEFDNVYRRAISGSDHNFLTIDTQPQGSTLAQRRAHRFRRNFDTFLVAPASIIKAEEEDGEPEEDARERARFRSAAMEAINNAEAAAKRATNRDPMTLMDDPEYRLRLQSAIASSYLPKDVPAKPLPFGSWARQVPSGPAPVVAGKKRGRPPKPRPGGGSV